MDIENESDHDDYTPKRNNNIISTSADVSNIHIKRRASKAPLVVFDVTRSDRLKVKTQGYKGSSCKGSSCFCCSTQTPTLSMRVIRSLGKDFCKIKPMNLSDEALQCKPSIKRAVRKISKASKQGKSLNDDKATKKNKKK
jgi:hypothetical protein